MKCPKPGVRGQFRTRVLLACFSLGACTAQAGHGYKGEPLLSMHGNATISALTAGQSIVPALCFFGDFLHHNPPIDWSMLPPEVTADFTPPPIASGPPLSALYFTQDRLTQIVDVESHGQFPAQFDVDVYLPPPDAALRSLFTGEPRMALGHVCAATTGHAPTTHRVQKYGAYGPQCAGPNGEGPCKRRTLWLVPGTQRFYTEGYLCPMADSDTSSCTLTAQGDPSLQYEYWAEQVLGADSGVDILYLAEAAPAGSYTAWGLGAPEGLTAGYHLYAGSDAPVSAYWEACGGFDTYQAAMVELAKLYPDVDLAMFPRKRVTEDFNDAYLPDAVIDAGTRLIAQKQMQQCAGAPPSRAVASTDLDLSIQIDQKDPNPPPF